MYGNMVQMPLYKSMPFTDVMNWLYCFRASLGDGIIILIIWAAGVLVFRSIRWFRNPGIGKVFLLFVSGSVIAISIELYAVSTGRWVYTALMPLVPPFDVGLSPYLQLLVLPIILMLLADHRKRVR